MDAALAASVARLVEMGLAGIVIIFQGLAIYTLYKQNQKSNEDRLADMRRCTEALVNAASSMDRSSDGLEEVRKVLTSLVAELQARRGRV